MKIHLILAGLALAFAASAEAATPSHQAAPPFERYLMAGDKEEIAFARTAAPPSVSADASVLVLGRTGYREVVRGRNGFVCFVMRSWTADFGDPVFWDPQIRAPNCFNPPAVRSVLPQYLARARWIIAGANEAQLEARTRAEFASRHFTAPEPGSFSFMLSPHSNLGEPANGGPWLPHVMFFIPHGQSPSWAAGLDGSPVIGKDGGPFEPTTLFVPVRRWSDGSPAPPATDLSHKM